MHEARTRDCPRHAAAWELPEARGTLSIVRWALPVTAVVSVAAHVIFAGALLLPRPHLDSSKESESLSGETVEIPAPETAEVPLANASPSPNEDGVPAPADGDAPAKPIPPKAKVAARPSHAGRPSGGHAPGKEEGVEGAGATPGLYGAVGDRSAVDLASAFTRGFPQAASADPAWRSAPLGNAGEAVVTLTLDESGHLVANEVSGSPSAALASGIRRTLALIGGRPFVAKGRTTRLAIHATITSDTVHDGLHGDVFAIGGSFANAEGSAFFALAIGRRIDLRVRLK